MILIPTVATQRASAEFVFTNFNMENDVGIHNKFYIFVLGLLMGQYTLVGYDASANMVCAFLLMRQTNITQSSKCLLKNFVWKFCDTSLVVNVLIVDWGN